MDKSETIQRWSEYSEPFQVWIVKVHGDPLKANLEVLARIFRLINPLIKVDHASGQACIHQDSVDVMKVAVKSFIGELTNGY